MTRDAPKRADQVMPVPSEAERKAVWRAIPHAPDWKMPQEIARAAGVSQLVALIVLGIYKDHTTCLFADEKCSFARYQRRGTTPTP